MKVQRKSVLAWAVGAAMLALTLGMPTASLATGGKKAAKWKQGAHVMVQWKGGWYKGTVLATKNGKYKVHYEGWSNSWDEWVGSGRIKAK